LRLEHTGGAADRGGTNITEMVRRGHDVEGARLNVVISPAFEFTASDPTAGCAESLGVGTEMVQASRSVPAREIPEIGRDTSRRSLAVISITSAVVMIIAPCALEPDRAGETGDPTEPRRDQSRRISA
jgi:hypothetical protein